MRLAYAGPLHLDEVSVPMDTIAAFNDIQTGFSMEGSRGRPLYLLYGPRQFGKSTIAYRIADWMAADPHLAKVECILVELRRSAVRDAATFWTCLGMHMEPESVCQDETAFIKLATRGQRRFCLILDEMDHLFDNKDLATTFLAALRTWKVASFFCGFLGVGSHDLVHHFKVFRGDMKSSPFNVGTMIKVGPFSLEQMSAFFTLVASRYPFSESLRRAIIDYSSGAPGVFGSMIRFTADSDKCTVERHEWERWFKVDAFSSYLTAYNNTYCRIQGDLHHLNDVEWEAVKYVLAHDGERMTASQVEGNCGISVRGDQDSQLVDPLLRMGVLIEGSDGALALVSEMMHRICVEALPVREIYQVASTDDSLELLCVALRFFNPQRISHQFVSNRQPLSESVFHLELFATIRDIMQKASLTRGFYAEVKTPDSRTRAEILLINGIRLAYEIKSNQLREKEITAAARQADQYRQQFQVDHMVVVNFAPHGHLLDPIYQVKQFEDILIVHAQYANSCDEFDLSYLVDGRVQHRAVKTLTKRVE